MKIFAFIVIGLLLLVTAGIFFLQDRLLFFPAILDHYYAFKFELPFEEKSIPFDGDRKMNALLFKGTNPIARILYFHGNGGALDGWGAVAQQIVDQAHCEILIVDYPGYGKSDGPLPSNADQLYESGRAAFAEFQKITDPKLPIILYGRSLGTGVASKLAGENQVQALILETPYTSIRDMAVKLAPFVPMFLLRYNMDNQENLKNVHAPVLIFHGTSDEVIPFEQGQLISKNFPAAQFVSVPHAGHNNIGSYPVYWRALNEFLKKLGSATP